MNDLLYLLGPLGCMAMVTIAAVLVTRGGRRSPPPADPEVAALRHEVARLRAAHLRREPLATNPESTDRVRPTAVLGRWRSGVREESRTRAGRPQASVGLMARHCTSVREAGDV